MSKRLFTNEEIAILSQNKYVEKVSIKGIKYTDELKREFIVENQNGKVSREIFEEHGFSIEILGIKREVEHFIEVEYFNYRILENLIMEDQVKKSYYLKKNI